MAERVGQDALRGLFDAYDAIGQLDLARPIAVGRVNDAFDRRVRHYRWSGSLRRFWSGCRFGSSGRFWCRSRRNSSRRRAVGSGSEAHAANTTPITIAVKAAINPSFDVDFNSLPFRFYSIDARDLFRASRSTKNGAPTSAVTTPTGISAGAITTLANVSAANRDIPPPIALSGIRAR